ncbi:MAG: DNA recombination protein RmuC, partial [Acidimicrobiales bacterium]|nr:DNA recombination protein RmuC [Acidimicrobiales bacterium]
LAARNYTDGDDSVDCVLLFIPNVAVYNLLHENDPEIIDVALGKQVALASGGILDVTFLLPRGMRLHMDAKFPLDNYAKYLEGTDDQVKDSAAKQFRTDVRTRVKDLAARNYTDGDDTVDCVLLFIPNEAVYNFLHENDPDIIDVALGKQVVLCSPFTLFSVLAVVRQSVENFKLTQRSSEILTELGRFREEWGRFSTHLEKVDKQMNTLYNSFESLTSTRVNKMVKTLDRIDRLQAGEADGPTALGGDVTVDLTVELGPVADRPSQQRLTPVVDDAEVRDIAG